MSTYKNFKSDKAKETIGIDLDLGASGKFKLARAGGSNSRFTRRMNQATQPFRRAIQLGTISDEESTRINAEVYAETVILSWEGVTGEDGKVLTFTRENAIKLLTDLPDLFTEIRVAANNNALFRADAQEQDAKN